MTGEDRDNDIAGLSNWHRALIISALLSGASSSFLGLTKDTTDRYKGVDAVRDLALRDERISELRRDLEEYRRKEEVLHRDLEQRLRELENR